MPPAAHSIPAKRSPSRLEAARKGGLRTPAGRSDPALTTDGSFLHKSNACNNYISVVRLFIRNVGGSRGWGVQSTNQLPARQSGRSGSAVMNIPIKFGTN